MPAHHAPALYLSGYAPAYHCVLDTTRARNSNHPLLNDTAETAVFKSAPLLYAAPKLTAWFFSGLLLWKWRVPGPLRPFIACHAALQTAASLTPRNQRPPLLEGTQEMPRTLSAPKWIPRTQPTGCTARLFSILKDTPETAGVQPSPLRSVDWAPAALFSSGSLRRTSARHIRPSRTKDRLRLTTKRKRGASIFLRFSLQDRCSPRCISSDNYTVETWSAEPAPFFYADSTPPALVLSGSLQLQSAPQKQPCRADWSLRLNDTAETAVFKSAPLHSTAPELTAWFFSGSLQRKRRVPGPLRSALQTSRQPQGFSSDPLRPFIACHAALQGPASLTPRNQRPPLLEGTQEMQCTLSASKWILSTQPTGCIAQIFFILKDTPETEGVKPAPLLSADSTPASFVSSGSLRRQSAPQKQHCRADWCLRLKDTQEMPRMKSAPKWIYLKQLTSCTARFFFISAPACHSRPDKASTCNSKHPLLYSTKEGPLTNPVRPALPPLPFPLWTPPIPHPLPFKELPKGVRERGKDAARGRLSTASRCRCKAAAQIIGARQLNSVIRSGRTGFVSGPLKASGTPNPCQGFKDCARIHGIYSPKPPGVHGNSFAARHHGAVTHLASKAASCPPAPLTGHPRPPLALLASAGTCAASASLPVRPLKGAPRKQPQAGANQNNTAGHTSFVGCPPLDDAVFYGDLRK